MLLERFLSYFNRVRSVDDATDTTIAFAMAVAPHETLAIHSLRYDVDENRWVVTLRRADDHTGRDDR